MLAGKDQQSADKSNRAAYWRHRYASAQEPKFFTNTNFVRDPDGEEVQREIELPEWLVRQLWLSQDPIASVHHYQVVMRIFGPSCFRVANVYAVSRLQRRLQYARRGKGQLF